MASKPCTPPPISAKVEVRTGKRCGEPSTRPDRWNRELMRGLALLRFIPTNHPLRAAGAAMDSESSKYRRIEEEYLIPVGFGWTVMVIALYIAVVVLQ
jgi:hypothetical protein